PSVIRPPIPRPPLQLSECDVMAEEILATAETDEDSTLALYGLVPDTARRWVHVTVAAACSTRARPAAAFGVYWGENSAHNRGLGIPGRQLDSRALLHAILFALHVANPARVLDISTSSKYAVRSICYLAGRNYTRSWSCANGDLLDLIAHAICSRPARTTFTALSERGTTGALGQAKALATAAC
ncbi:hypothetical protein DFH08DRAFT_626219, partial [Mycena albidolilacea]